MQRYADAAARHGTRPAGGHVAAIVAQVADSRAEARRLLRARLPRWLGPGLAGYVPVDGRARAARDPDGYAELLSRAHPVGTAADCAKAMTATARRTGIDHLMRAAATPPPSRRTSPGSASRAERTRKR